MTHILKYDQFGKQFMNDRGMLLSGNELHGLSAEFKFGHNDAIGTSYAVVAENGLCRTPLPSNATTLRVKAGGDAADVAGGAGARSILLQGIGSDGSAIQEVLVLAGASASASTAQPFMRLLRALVLESGHYSTNMLGGGSAATITIENTAGTEDWMLIRFNGFADCQSQSTLMSIATGQRAYLSGLNLFVDSNKVVDFLLVFRANFMQTDPGFQPVRMGSELNGVAGDFNYAFPEPPRFFEYTDITLLAKVASGSAKVSANLTYLVNENGDANA